MRLKFNLVFFIILLYLILIYFPNLKAVHNESMDPGYYAGFAYDGIDIAPGFSTNLVVDFEILRYFFVLINIDVFFIIGA